MMGRPTHKQWPNYSERILLHHRSIAGSTPLGKITLWGAAPCAIHKSQMLFCPFRYAFPNKAATMYIQSYPSTHGRILLT
uniref:Uncharacterized protein n=1 Tax=Arundo donax TaxID=35708 RepID=A0A0A9HQV2_ARUDO